MATDQYIREATKNDVQMIYKFIKDLAEYEKAESECILCVNDLMESLFPSNNNPAVFAHVACSCIDTEIVIGMAVWHLNYSTWTGKHGIYLEDLYVDPLYRGKGFGKMLLKQLATICKERGYQRFQWWCLKWNKPSIDFYQSIGAKSQDEWTVFRVDGKELDLLASTD